MSTTEVKSGALGVVDIDHLMIRAADLGQAASAYEKLGFFVTPLRKKVPWSSSGKELADAPPETQRSTVTGRQILFKPYPGRTDVANFLNIYCIEDQMLMPPEVTQVFSFLLDSEGPRTIVGYTADVGRAREAMTALGIKTNAPLDYESGWQDEERDVFIRIQARPCVPIFGQIPFQFDPYETQTLAGYQYAPWTVHPNSARYMAGVTGVTHNIRRDAEFMAHKIFGVDVEWQGDEVAVIRPRDLFLRVMTPKGFGQLFEGLDFSSERILPHTVGVSFAVASLDVVEKTLRKNGVAMVKTRLGICVPRQAACNTLIEFIPADKPLAY